MTNLTVWKLDTAAGAASVLARLPDLQKQHLLKLVDAAVVSWPVGAKKPRTQQAVELVRLGALDGAFWGMLFGMIFFVPLLGMALGGALGALSGSFKDYGINDEFIKDCRAQVTEGTSALFLLTQDEVGDRVREALKEVKMDLIQSNLSSEQEASLRQHFSA